MAYKKLNSGQRRFTKAKALLVTPYSADGTLGADTYDINDIIADTLTLSQDDPETEETDHEFSDSPLLTNTTIGSWQFSATCIDFQNDIMHAIYGARVSEDGVVLFPEQYKELYALVHIKFDDGTPDVYIPKLQLASKATLENLKSGVAQGEFTGTAVNHEMQIKNGVSIVQIEQGKDSYSTPVAYVPQNLTVYVKSGEGFATESTESGS